MAKDYLRKQTKRRSNQSPSGDEHYQYRRENNNGDNTTTTRSSETGEKIPLWNNGVFIEKRSVLSSDVAIALWSSMFGERLSVMWLRTLGLCLVLLVMSAWGRNLVNTAPAVDPDELSPVVFVPGHGGNQLEIKVNLEKPVLEHCQAKTDWTRSWLNLWQFLPGEKSIVHKRLLSLSFM